MRLSSRSSKNRLPELAIWLVMAIFFMPLPFFSQEEKVHHDGTEGELFKSKKELKDTTVRNYKYKNWNQFDGPLTTLRIGGGFLYDYVTYVQDNESKQQIKCEPAFKTRDARLVMSGQFKFKREVSWKAGLMYDGTKDVWMVRETGVLIGLPKMSGRVFVGRSKEGFSLNKIMNGYAGWSMERQMGIDVIPILADGIKYMGYFPTSRMILNVGVFTDWLSKSQSFSTYEWQAVGRVGFLPVYVPEKKKVLHLALSMRYGKILDGNMRLRSRPESNPSPYFVDTDVFPSGFSYHGGLEIYYTSGSWMFGGEYSAHQFLSPESKDPLFHGGEIMASWIITGESRTYLPGIGAYGFVPVNRSVFAGGPGAWEIMVRLTNIDLDAGTLTGGKFWRFTPMINWYLSSNVRLELAYGYGVLDRFNRIGATQFFQSRIQFMF